LPVAPAASTPATADAKPHAPRAHGEPHARAGSSGAGHVAPVVPTHGTATPRDAAHDAAEAERRHRDAAEAQRRQDREAAAARAEAAAALRRAEAARAKAAAERHRLEAALRTAHGDVTQREREVVKLEHDLAHARTMVVQAKAVVEDLEDRLAQLDN
jgi:chromosome segregation ATPase